MKLRFRLVVCLLMLVVFVLTGCNISVTAFPYSPEQPAESPAEPPTELPPTPYPDTPAPAVLDAPLVESPAFVEIHFVNELDAWGVTETQIVRTNDGGITWYSVTPPDVAETGATVETFILDEDHAWVQKPDFNNFPNNGLLYHTVDGGLTWRISSTPFSSGDISFLDTNRGWMLADLGVGAGSNAVAVFQTINGGVTWTQTYINDPNNPEAGDSLPLGGIKSSLAPLSMQTAWVGGVIYSPGTVYLYRTEDGGSTWLPVNIELPESTENFELSIDRNQLQFITPDDGFLVLRMAGDLTQSAVYVTNNGGNTWTLTPTLIPNAGASDFLSAQEVVIYNGEQFYVTRDAAKTWTTISPNIVFGDSFVAMDFVNPNTGWVVTSDPANHRSLYRTNDGGATWLPVIP